MPDRVIAPLRELRQPLHDGLRYLPAAAAAVTSGDTKQALAALSDALAYLQGTLVPLCRSEQFTLFPAVDGVLGSVGATNVMLAQHQSIAAMVDDLAAVEAAARRDDDIAPYSRYLLPLLYGLYAGVRLHLESEDDAYLSLLDEHLSESQVGVIVDNLTRVAAGNAAPGG